jgi:2-phosphosulfolactate phosphatase
VRQLEVTLTPASFLELQERPLKRATCVVFDVLRATSTMLEALANGASVIYPADGIPAALALKGRHPTALLAGERNGFKITPETTGGIPFDLGNSPREFTSARVAGRAIIMTTTNGTRALHACRGAGQTLVASFANLGAIASHIAFHLPDQLILVCSGTGEKAALEDTLGAGALLDRLWGHYEDRNTAIPDDSALIAYDLYRSHRTKIAKTVAECQNGRRLLSIPELADDVPLCLKADRLDVVGALGSDGAVRVWE